jgi:hypothetical protein
MTDKKPPIPDWAQDMAQIPFNPNAERAAFNFSHSPCGMTPKDLSVSQSVKAAPPDTGWVERPMVNPDNPQHPVPGIAQCDRLMAAAERAERKEAQQPDLTRVMEAAMAMMQVQSQQIAILVQKFMKEDRPGDKKS